MGYTSQVIHTSATLVPNCDKRLVKAMKDLVARDTSLYFRPDIETAEDIDDVLDAISWQLDPLGQLTRDSGKYYSDEDVFKAIAPFIKSGTEIVFAGEDHALWRFFFDGKTMHHDKNPIITWPQHDVFEQEEIKAWPPMSHKFRDALALICPKGIQDVDAVTVLNIGKHADGAIHVDYSLWEVQFSDGSTFYKSDLWGRVTPLVAW